MQTSYFQRTYETAVRNADEYINKNEGQRGNLAFCAHGNLSRASSNRLQRINGVSHDKRTKKGVRKIMLDLFNTDVFRRVEYNNIKYTMDVNWDAINAILNKMNLYSAWTDETDYIQAEMSTGLFIKVESMVYFINRYGSSTDKKILIPKIYLD